MTGVSFVVPVRNGRASVRRTLESIFAQHDGQPMEVIVVDDRSTDGSLELLQQLTAVWPIQLVKGSGRGAAAALNTGIRRARFSFICQVDQDVVLEAGWVAHLVAALQDETVGAAQGWYQTDPRGDLFARVMGRDLEERYSVLGIDVDHVCTGNVAYKLSALRQVGPFDESLGYSYDNDMSYRLRSSGLRLVLCPQARSTHRWRHGLRGYIAQQYGFGYGRLDLIAKYPRRIGGDAVSPLSMMIHPVVMAAAVCLLVAAGFVKGAAASWMSGVGVAAIVALVAERLLRGMRAARRFRDATPLLFPAVHLLRDLVWVWAIVVWCARRLGGAPARPSDSMRPHPATWPGGSALPRMELSGANRVLAVIPAHNEACNLPSVVAEIRTCPLAVDVLVVDDGSTDETVEIVQGLGVRWLRLPERMGIGAAMRVALRYATAQGYGAVVRLDGDGQHGPGDIPRLLALLHAGAADVVLGARDARDKQRAAAGGLLQRMLAACLTAITDATVTDPTSGFYALGTRAIRILAEHHPTGYPEAELRLFMSRNGMRALEVPVATRSRLSGRTSLTPARLVVAAARVALAMCVVPFRRAVPDVAHD